MQFCSVHPPPELGFPRAEGQGLKHAFGDCRTTDCSEKIHRSVPQAFCTRQSLTQGLSRGVTFLSHFVLAQMSPPLTSLPQSHMPQMGPLLSYPNGCTPTGTGTHTAAHTHTGTHIPNTKYSKARTGLCAHTHTHIAIHTRTHTCPFTCAHTAI